jgi:serine/threonine protein kinase
MTLIGPYRIIRPLSAGAFARTYEAEHTLLRTRACLKITQRREDNDMLAREAQILWSLHHPCLPAVRDFFLCPDGTAALAERFVEGTPLDRATPIDGDTAFQVLGRLLRLLKMLHHRGIVHNDIKPANIILEPDRHGVVLVDFGMSSLRPRSTSHAAGFTPLFAAPEVQAGRPPLPESDLYSLGLSVLWALGGDVERRILPRGVREPLLDLLVQLTRRDPSDRPSWEQHDPLAKLTSFTHQPSPG